MNISISPADIPKLAQHFASVLAENLAPQTITACADEQKNAPEGICVLHDVCDPNEYMLQALKRTFPALCASDGCFDYDPHDDEVGRLIEAAWPLGRYMLFATTEIQSLRATVAHAHAAAMTLSTAVGRALNNGIQVEQLRHLLWKGLNAQMDILSRPEEAAPLRSWQTAEGMICSP